MPGARAAWLTVGDQSLIPHMTKVQSCCSANCGIISQFGLKGALTQLMDNPSTKDDVQKYYMQRTDIMAEGLNKLGAKYGLGEICIKPEGTFYLWADFSALTGVETDMQLQQHLLEMPEMGVAVIPGAAFSMQPSDKRLRINCARDDLNELNLGLEVFDRALEQLTSGLTARL